MKKIKNLLISFLVAACAVCLSLAFVACSDGGDKSGSKYGYGEEGVYYYSADSDTDYLMTLQSGTYMISLKGVSSYSGTYSYDAEAGTVSFTSIDGETFEASFADDAMQLAISGQPYTFLRNVNETVTFMDGNSVVDTRTVTYGKAAETIDGEKSGYIFLGWYEDKSFTTKYTFDTAVTGNLTLYAYYIEIDSTIANFDVNFVMDGETVYSTKTQNGVVYDIPDVGGILGWWVSDTNDGSELTYKYDGQILDEATNLYAVKADALGASVYGDKVTWEGSASSVTITVDGKVETSSAANGAYAYDFDSLSTGSHEIEVSASGYGTENLVYVVNRLARVSNFSVYGTTLVYNAVENAQYYYVSVTCANPSHDHTMVYNGKTLTYDFSNCEMGPDGITFTVYAYGTGYTESVSETYVYALILDNTEVSIDASTDTASWTAVSGATGYEIYVNGEYVAATTNTEYSLKNYNQGTVTVSVKPTAPGYWSEESEAVSYTKATLPAPEITGIDEYTVSWSRVDGATNYIIYVNGKQIETVESDITSYALAGDADFVKADSYVITIKATNSSDTNQNSQESDSVYATDETMSPLLVYEDGTVYWQYAMAVGTYYVSINDGDETEVYGKNSFDVMFTQSGENVIKVYFKTDAGNSAVASLSVTTYAVIFDARGGDSVDTIYVAKGDTLSLPTPVYGDNDADFIGWYTLPDLLWNIDSEEYLGEGYLVENGSVFASDGTLVLYAGWQSVKLNVVLDAGMGAVYDGNGDETNSALIAKNSSSFTLPVPTSDDVTYIFYGWYSGENGSGTRYTDSNGNAVRTYNAGGGSTLYAYWRQVVDFSLTVYHNSYVLSAFAGEAIREVTEVTVPATYVYNGTEYTVAVIGATAFNNCSNLVTINLPDTIEYISITNNGYSSGNGSFAGSDKLQNINVYGTGDEPTSTKEITYYSGDGVLFRVDSLTGYVELVYYPQGRTDTEYTMPSTVAVYGYDENGDYTVFELDESGNPVERKVEAIATQVFRGKTVSTIIIPSTVVYVETQAFYYANVKTVTFSGDAGDALTIEDYAFQQCSSMTEITLPARLSSFKTNIFSGCSKLANIYVSGTGSYGSIGGVLGSADGTTIYYYPLGRSAGMYTIPEGVTTISEEAFSKATNLTGLVVAKSVTTISEKAFYNCTKMTSLEFLGEADSSDLYIETMAFYGCTGLTSVTLPQNLVGLAEYSFGGCTNLTEVTYDSRPGATASGLSGLEAYAFSSSGSTSANSYVKVLNLGKNVPNIQFASIFGGTQLTTINITEGNENFSSENGVVFGNQGKEILYFPSGWVGGYVVPDTVETIGADTFSGCKGLTSIVISASVQTIGQSAFLNCTGLTEVTFASLTEEQIEAGVSAAALAIADSAFSGCSGLTNIELPSRLQTLGDGVFMSCTQLEAITVESGSEYFTSQNGILYQLGGDGVTPIKLLVCPINCKETDIVILNTITEIGGSAFANNANITKISFVEDKVASDSFVINDGAFSECLALEEITLPEGLTYIGVNTFYSCVALMTITIPSTVTTIEKASFYGCTSLENVIFAGDEPRTTSNSLEIVSGTSTTSKATAGAFYSCTALEEIEFPEYTTIGNYTFYNCKALKSVTLSENTEVGTYVFCGCSGLESMVIPKGVTSIGDRAFYNCTGLETIELGENVTTIGSYVFYGCTALAEVNVKGAITSIDTYAFYNCSSLTSLDLGEGLESLPASVFYGSGLVNIKLPASLKTITNTTFQNCNSLQSIDVAQGSLYFDVVDNVLYEIDNGNGTGAGEETALWIYPKASTVTTITIPATVTTVHRYAFTSSNVVNVTFADYNGNDTYSLTFENISSSDVPFSGCSDLNKVVLPEGLTEVNQYLFYQTSIRSVVIPSTVKTVGDRPFHNCSNLEEVVFTAGGTDDLTFTNGSSSYATFSNCTSLESVTLPDRPTVTLGTYMFRGCSGLETVTFGRGVVSVPNYIFQNCTSLSTVNFGSNSITTIGQYAFSNCGSLNITLPDTVTKLDNYAFESSGIVSITFNSGLEEIGTYVFQSCTSLSSVEIPASLTSLGNYAFSKCSGLLSLTFASGAQALTIGTYAFQYCTSLASVEIGSRVTSIGNYAFAYCDTLSSVRFEDGSSIESIGNYAFAYSGIKNFVFPVTSAETLSLGDQMFADCYDIEEIFISVSVTDLGTSLNNCYARKISVDSANNLFGVDVAQPILYGYIYENGEVSVTQIVKAFGEIDGKYEIPETVEQIGTYAFYNQKKLTEVVIPQTVVAIDGHAFDGCDLLSLITFADESDIELGDYVFQNCTALVAIDCSAITSYGSNTFTGCTSLSDVALRADLTDLGDYMFDGCSDLEEIELPDTLVYMGAYTFRNTGLVEIVIPEGVTDMGALSGTAAGTSTSAYVFYGCGSLEKVVLPSKLETMGSSVFYGCSSLNIITYNGDPNYDSNEDYSVTGYVALPDTMTVVGSSAFRGTALVEVTLPALTSYGSNMFYDCDKLTTINFSASLTVTTAMFYNCYSLVNVDFDHVTSVSQNSFRNCTSLEYADLSHVTSLSQTSQNVFQGCTSLVEVVWCGISSVLASFFQDCTSLAIFTNAEKVTSVNNYAFQNCALSDYSVFSNVTSVSNYGFSGCKFTDVDLTDVTSLAIHAFRECTELVNVVMPTSSSVTSTTNYLFYGCTSLKNVVMSSNLVKINQYSFYGCSSLLSIDLSYVTTIETYSFYGCSSLVSLQLGNGLTEITANAFQGCSSLVNVEFPDTLTTIRNYAFDGCTSLETLVIPAKVSTLGTYCFQGCESLVDIDYQGTYATISNYTFYGCSSLENVVLSEYVTTIGQYAFYGCSSLKEISFPSSLKTVNTYAFFGGGFETLYIPANLTSIDSMSFAACENLTRFIVDGANTSYRSGTSGELIKVSNNTIISWPSGYEGVATLERGSYITTNTFAYCGKLTSVVFPEDTDIDSIPNYAFEYCTSLESIVLPSTITSIGDYAFAYSGLKNIVISSSVTSIGQYAFAYSALESVEFKGNPTTIGNYAFAYCESLKSVKFSDTYTTIGSYMFAGCTAVESIDIPSSVTSVGASAFYGWTEDQTINVGFTEGEVSWTSGWDTGCDANVVYAV